MRRTAEHDYVTSLTQIGIRNVSSTGRDYAHAISTNSTIISVRQASRLSTTGVLERIPAGKRYYVGIAIDGFNPFDCAGHGNA
jgi:agmatinase